MMIENPTVQTSQDFLSQVNHEIAHFPFPAQPQGLYEPISYVLAMGGKRIRPVFLLLAHQLYAQPSHKALQAAVALEIFHNYTLLHDDLMDNADKRRDKPTVHKHWDANTAILSGDAMLEVAYRHMFQAASGCPDALAAFLKTCVEVSEGQQYDMDFEQRLDVTLPAYYEMIRLKTGVLVACALQVGALMGGADTAQSLLLYQYGAAIGRAFQLRDDYLDTFGDAAVFGKRIGGDILEGKKTFLLVSALEKASTPLRREMEQWLQRKDADEQEKIAYFTQIYKELGIPADYEREMERCFLKSDALFQQMDAPHEAKQALKSFADSLNHRIY